MHLITDTLILGNIDDAREPMPVIAALLAWVLLGEILGWVEIGGALVVLIIIFEPGGLAGIGRRLRGLVQRSATTGKGPSS